MKKQVKLHTNPGPRGQRPIVLHIEGLLVVLVVVERPCGAFGIPGPCFIQGPSLGGAPAQRFGVGRVVGILMRQPKP